MKFLVNEIFTSIQGEGLYTGLPAHFVRFQGCPIKCPFCDSAQTWRDGINEQFATYSFDALKASIVYHVDKYPLIKDIVLTGGEPLYGHNGDNLPALIQWLKERGMRVHIETSAAARYLSSPLRLIEQLEEVVLVISPKQERGIWLLPEPALLPYASLIKILVSDDKEENKDSIDTLYRWLLKVCPDHQLRFAVQPIWFAHMTDAEILRYSNVAADLAKERGWLLSLQTHKFINIR